MARKKGKGWHGDPRGHRKAALKGWKGRRKVRRKHKYGPYKGYGSKQEMEEELKRDEMFKEAEDEMYGRNIKFRKKGVSEYASILPSNDPDHEPSYSEKQAAANALLDGLAGRLDRDKGGLKPSKPSVPKKLYSKDIEDMTEENKRKLIAHAKALQQHDQAMELYEKLGMEPSREKVTKSISGVRKLDTEETLGVMLASGNITKKRYKELKDLYEDVKVDDPDTFWKMVRKAEGGKRREKNAVEVYSKIKNTNPELLEEWKDDILRNRVENVMVQPPSDKEMSWLERNFDEEELKDMSTDEKLGEIRYRRAEKNLNKPVVKSQILDYIDKHVLGGHRKTDPVKEYPKSTKEKDTWIPTAVSSRGLTRGRNYPTVDPEMFRKFEKKYPKLFDKYDAETAYQKALDMDARPSHKVEKSDMTVEEAIEIVKKNTGDEPKRKLVRPRGKGKYRRRTKSITPTEGFNPAVFEQMKSKTKNIPISKYRVGKKPKKEKFDLGIDWI